MRTDQFQAVVRLKCFHEKTQAWHLMTFAEWHGWMRHCLRCGDAWSNETETGEFERLQRPFAKGWRKDAVARLKKKAEGVPRMTATEMHKEWRKAMDAYWKEMRGEP